MQEFLINNTISCNLMSLTGYRTLVVLEALLESPKTNDELNDYLFNNQYVKEKFSRDTLRIYINSLRAIGCEITWANNQDKKYELISHPFAYDIPKSQLKALSKIYKNIHYKIEIREAIAIENFFNKISNLVKNEETKNLLNSFLLLKHIDKNVLNDILIHCKNKNQITFMYNSPKSGVKEIEIVADKLSFKSEKLYLWGKNLTHKEYSFFSVERILKICSIKIIKNKEEFLPVKITYELSNNDNHILEPDEKIIEKNNNKVIIEATSQNEFELMQRILYMAGDCKVIQPEEFKAKLLTKLKSMETNYENV